MNILTKVKSGSALFWRTEKNSPRSLSTDHAAFEITLLSFALHTMALPKILIISIDGINIYKSQSNILLYYH